LLFFLEKGEKKVKNLGVTRKGITGDNHRAALFVSRATGRQVSGVLTGAELNPMRDQALWQQADKVNLF